MDEKILRQLSHELELHAKGLGLPIGSSKIFIEKSLSAAEKSLSKRSIITNNDIVRAVTKELRKYNSDLSYIYQNHDKII